MSLILQPTAIPLNPKFSGSTLSLESVGDLCRICYSGCKKEVLISPCNCSGSVGLIHASCLGQWILSKKNTKDESASPGCEICHTAYKYKIVPRRGSYFKYLLTVKRVPLDILSILLVLSLAAFFIAIFDAWVYNVIIFWDKSLLSLIGLLNLWLYLILFLISGTCILIRNHYNRWIDWGNRNAKVKILDLKPSKKTNKNCTQTFLASQNSRNDIYQAKDAETCANPNSNFRADVVVEIEI